MVIGDVLRFCRFLRVRRLVLSGVKFVGFVKCFLKELAMLLLELWMILLNFMERLGSVEVGSLLFKDLIVFQYVVVFCLLSHGVKVGKRFLFGEEGECFDIQSELPQVGIKAYGSATVSFFG